MPIGVDDAILRCVSGVFVRPLAVGSISPNASSLSLRSGFNDAPVCLDSWKGWSLMDWVERLRLMDAWSRDRDDMSEDSRQPRVKEEVSLTTAGGNNTRTVSPSCKYLINATFQLSSSARALDLNASWTFLTCSGVANAWLGRSELGAGVNGVDGVEAGRDLDRYVEH